ncbi:MAG: hypothetical protein K8T90_18015 [Planctomycetes bacterium]|nr:hypothetical protein [Planctomycetota bacterium]
MAYLHLYDPIFDRQVSLRDAYRMLEAFVVQYNARGESSTVSLMSDICVSPGGESSDPAQMRDFVRVAGDVLRDESLRTVASGGGAG